MDYCNGIYGGLSENDLYHLQKLQNSAVRLIFGLKLSDREHMTPFLKTIAFPPSALSDFVSNLSFSVQMH